MSKFLYVYHGGTMAETEEERNEIMAAWRSWFTGMGEAVADGGNPVGLSSTVHSDGSVTSDGGANPASGYTLVNADNIDQALEMAKKCPILDGGGSVEVAEAIEIDM